MSDPQHIRNFAIIAHIDHGKSTLADRLIEVCSNTRHKDTLQQVLDSMEIERERGITIKSQTVQLSYKTQKGEQYLLNLIDTPGHVDFSYEVDRSLSACEGSILVIDTTQGMEAQTLANVYKAFDNNHQIIVALNKVDLPTSNINHTKQQIKDLIGFEGSIVEISAKTGQGVILLLETMIKKLPAPKPGKFPHQLQALLIDSWYDQYIGVILLVRVMSGQLKEGTKIKMMSNNIEYIVDKVGVFLPNKKIVVELNAGEIGFISANIKQINHCNVGDTITTAQKACLEVLPGFQLSKPVIFCSIYPLNINDYYNMCDSMAKLRLNDSSFVYESESSKALGFGFRCGFLGMLHLDIIQERLKREFSLDLIATAPSVVYKFYLRDGTKVNVHNPVDMPDMAKVKYIEEPLAHTTIMLPKKYLGAVIALCISKRGVQKTLSYIDDRIMLVFKLPLNEIIFDFYDKLKSCSKGYASCNWKLVDYSQADLVLLSIFINHVVVDSLSFIIHHTTAQKKGREICLQLKSLIARHLFAIPIQAKMNGQIIARETISPLRKDVTAKCYGGDVTRKRKLLDKQKKGKRRLRSIGNVNIPQSAFISILKVVK